MRYKITCPGCKKTSKYSDRDADKYSYQRGIWFEWDCPNCGGLVSAAFLGKNKSNQSVIF